MNVFYGDEMFNIIKQIFCRHKNKKITETAKGIYWHYQRYTDCADCGIWLNFEIVRDENYEPIHIKSIEDMIWEERINKMWEAGERQRQVNKWNKLEQLMFTQSN